MITYEIGIGLTGARDVIAGRDALRALRDELGATSKAARGAGTPKAVVGSDRDAARRDKEAAAAREHVYQIKRKQSEKEEKNEARSAASRAKARDHVIGLRKTYDEKERKAEAKAAGEFGKAKEYVYQLKQKQESKAEKDERRDIDRREKSLAAAKKYVSQLRLRQEASDQKAEASADTERRKAKEYVYQLKQKQESKEEIDEKKRRDKRTKGAKESLSGVSTGIKIAGAAGVASGVAGFAGMAQFALGYRGVAQLQMLAMRAQIQFRQLFTGVDPSPVVRAFDRLTQNFSKTTSTGRVLSDVLTRGFNGAFWLIERGEPYVTAFGEGMLLSALRLENGFLKARLSLLPVEIAIRRATGGVYGLSLAASAGGLVFNGIFAAAVYSAGSSVLGLGVSTFKAAIYVGGLATSAVRAIPGIVSMGTAAAAAAAPWIALGAAVAGVAAAIDQAIKLSKVWDSSSAGQLWHKFRKDIGAAPSEADLDKAAGIKTYDDAGTKSGAALADGLVAGMKSREGGVRAGGAELAAQAEYGLQAKAEIHSPSRLMRRNAQQMGEGVRLGMRDKAPEVQREAARSLVPSLAAAPGAGAAGIGGDVVIHVHVEGPVYGIDDLEERISMGARRAFREALHDTGKALGAF